MKKWIILSSIIGFFALVIFISTLYMSDDTLKHDGHIPDEISNYVLVTEIEGDEAKEIVSKVHGREDDLNQAYVLEYQTGNKEYAIAWISEFNQNDTATEIYESIKKNNQANLEQTEIANYSVLYKNSDKSKTFYFVKENRLILVTAFEDKKDRFIKNAIKIF